MVQSLWSTTVCCIMVCCVPWSHSLYSVLCYGTRGRVWLMVIASSDKLIISSRPTTNSRITAHHLTLESTKLEEMSKPTPSRDQTVFPVQSSHNKHKCLRPLFEKLSKWTFFTLYLSWSFLVRPCLLITMIKCLTGQKSPGWHMFQKQKWVFQSARLGDMVIC